MGLTAAGIAAIAGAAISTAGTAYAASQAGKGSGKKTRQGPTPQQQAIQQIVSRAFIDRYNQGPQTFGEFRAAGGKRMPPPMFFNPMEAQALGYQHPQQSSWRLPSGERISPQSFTPQFLQQQQQSLTPEALQMYATTKDPSLIPPWAGEYGGRGNLWFIQGDPMENILKNLKSGTGPQVTRELHSGMDPRRVAARHQPGPTFFDKAMGFLLPGYQPGFKFDFGQSLIPGSQFHGVTPGPFKDLNPIYQQAKKFGKA
jgi:hypothetical protein